MWSNLRPGFACKAISYRKGFLTEMVKLIWYNAKRFNAKPRSQGLRLCASILQYSWRAVQGLYGLPASIGLISFWRHYWEQIQHQKFQDGRGCRADPWKIFNVFFLNRYFWSRKGNQGGRPKKFRENHRLGSLEKAAILFKSRNSFDKIVGSAPSKN